MVILVADSGGSKTDWLLKEETSLKTIQTKGLNPNILAKNEICSILKKQVYPWLKKTQPKTYFFGAGLAKQEQRDLFTCLLKKELQLTIEPYVDTDLTAAAYATLGNTLGVVAIMGTGSVAFYYNGQEIQKRQGGYGYLLGDEGSGFAIGQSWVQLYLKNKLPLHLNDLYNNYLQLTKDELIAKVYTNTGFLAQQTFFIAKHLQEPMIKEFLSIQFAKFLEQTLCCCVPNKQTKIVFMGGIATSFFSCILPLCNKLGLSNVHLYEKAPVYSLYEHITSIID